MDFSVTTSLDQCVPLIMCSCCLECEALKEVVNSIRNSSMPDRWKILLLYQTGNENLFQHNEGVKVIHADMENGIPTHELLEWLKIKLPIRSSDGQQDMINRTCRF